MVEAVAATSVFDCPSKHPTLLRQGVHFAPDREQSLCASLTCSRDPQRHPSNQDLCNRILNTMAEAEASSSAAAEAPPAAEYKPKKMVYCGGAYVSAVQRVSASSILIRQYSLFTAT